ncbi:MAG: hypothetical protein HP491_17280 [Nitrospira sp.]|nr:hypothetical protein [Nitrospira sp.]
MENGSLFLPLIGNRSAEYGTGTALDKIFVEGVLKFRTDDFGKKNTFFNRLSESTSGIWVNDLDSKQTTFLLEKDSHRLKAVC